MYIRFACSHCGNPLEAPEDSAGKLSVCPQCKQGIVIPYKAITEVPVQQEPDIHLAPMEQRKINTTVAKTGMSESSESQDICNGDKK